MRASWRPWSRRSVERVVFNTAHFFEDQGHGTETGRGIRRRPSRSRRDEPGRHPVVLSASFKPRERTIFFAEFKMLNLRSNEMTGDARHDLQEAAISDSGYAFDLPMMIGD